MRTFKLGEPFEIWGHWWLPGDPANVMPGRLSSRLGNLQLKLLGCFDNVDVNTRNLVVPAIHGAADSNEFTLWRAVQDTPSFRSPGTIEQTFSKLRVVVGAHLSNECETRVTAIGFDAPERVNPFETVGSRVECGFGSCRAG